MSFRWALFVSLCLVLSADTISPELQRAQDELYRVRGLVAAGAAPVAQLEKAQQEVIDAEDDELLRQTLYGSISVDELTKEQSNEMLAAAQRRVDRQKNKVEDTRKLIEAGVLSRLALNPFIEELDRRHRALDLAHSRAQLLNQLIEMARAEQEEDEPEPQEPHRVAVRFDGNGMISTSLLRQVEDAYEREFEKSLPVSARGDTAVHRAMGFDHRGRMDVALNPDQPEGVWLRTYLESERIPYIAFRAAVQGQATAPHIHIGPPSNRWRSAD